MKGQLELFPEYELRRRVFSFFSWTLARLSALVFLIPLLLALLIGVYCTQEEATDVPPAAQPYVGPRKPPPIKRPPARLAPRQNIVPPKQQHRARR